MFPVKPSFLSYFKHLINLFSKKRLYIECLKIVLKHYSVNVYLKTFRKP